MPSINMALYRVLVDMGTDKTQAEHAATVDTSALATKADLDLLRAGDLLEHGRGGEL